MPLAAQRLDQRVDHVDGCAGIHLAGQLDEARRHAVLARLPGEIERIDRNAVPAEPGPRIERHEAERLGLGCVDHLPDIDAHRGVKIDLELVDERDIDGAEDVLGQLHRLRRRADWTTGTTLVMICS